ncbi:MAG: cytoplasmic protein [Deltaproteobacteria bacterium]|nr:cytoplasmic protein [Deltaproteobacteria bacterium]
MLKNDLLFSHPLKHIRDEGEQLIPEEGGFGAVLSRAGVGKTAFLVQLALHAMLENKYVLHISLIDPVDKVTLWYKELFNGLGQHYKLAQVNQLWQTILPFRFIMTFRVSSFSIPKLQERLTDLSQQDIFKPEIIIIDGFQFDETALDFLSNLRALARTHGCRVWFSVHTHRHEDIQPDGMPARLSTLSDSFNLILKLEPAGSIIKIVPIKGIKSRDGGRPVYLDSSTMLISE